MRPVLVPLILFAGMLYHSTPVWAEEHLVDEAFLQTLSNSDRALVREYLNARERLLRAYTCMTLEGNVQRESQNGAAGGELSIVSEYSGTFMVRDGNWFRITGTKSDVPFLAILTPTDGYAFAQDPKTNEYFLLSEFKSNSEIVQREIGSFRYDKDVYQGDWFYALICGDKTGGTLELDSLELSNENGVEVVTASLRSETKYLNGGVQFRIHIYRFLRNRLWAMKEHLAATPVVSDRKYVTATTRVEYGEDSDGIPILATSMREYGRAPFAGEEIDFRRRYSAGPTIVVGRDSIAVTKIDYTVPDMSNFDTEPYLKRLGRIGTVTRTPQALYWGLFNGVLLAILGMVLLLFSQRSKRRTSEHHIRSPSKPDSVTGK